MVMAEVEVKEDMRIFDYSHQLLIEMRKAKGLKQSELAKLLDITQGAVANYEKGRMPSWEVLKQLGEIFDVYFVADWSGAFSEKEKPVFKDELFPNTHQ